MENNSHSVLTACSSQAIVYVKRETEILNLRDEYMRLNTLF